MTSSSVKFVPIMIFCLATGVGIADAAGEPQSPPTVSNPQVVFPPAKRISPQREPTRDVAAAPTPDLTEVVNHLQVQAKSLNTLITVAPGLALAKAVTISIAYLSPFPQSGYERRTETYSSANGNSFLYSDLEGDGKPRKIHMDISLSEPKAGGGVVTYDIPLDFTLDPLYDVQTSLLHFTLVRGCVHVGANQISVHWYFPETRDETKYQTVHFATKEGETFNLREFIWSRSEVSSSLDLRKILVWYEETGIHNGFGPYPGPSEENLVPGKTYRSDQGLIKSWGAARDCEATVDYTVAYQLQSFLGAPVVRDHR